MKNIIITIKVQDGENQILAKAEAFNFESAAEQLGKLERFVKKLSKERVSICCCAGLSNFDICSDCKEPSEPVSEEEIKEAMELDAEWEKIKLENTKYV